jgi:hypothetical protein
MPPIKACAGIQAGQRGRRHNISAGGDPLYWTLIQHTIPDNEEKLATGDE